MSEVVAIGSLGGDGTNPVGVQLAQLRKAQGLTGAQLGDLASMSQAKISKIETGKVRPSARDVERIGRALGAPVEAVRRLAEEAEASHNQMTDWRLRFGQLATVQRELAQLESSATTSHIFQSAAIPGLLQTSEYARAILANTQRGLTGDTDPTPSAVPEAVSARVQRQEVLADSTKSFRFVMPESALEYLVSRPADMPAQIHRIREVAQQDNVTVAIIPSTAPLPMPPLHGFEMLDRRIVIIDLFNTALTSRGHADVQFYQRLFTTFEAHASVDIDPILDHYLGRYLDLARPRPR